MDLACQTLVTEFPHLIERTLGSLDVRVHRAVSSAMACPGALVFAGTEPQLREALERRAGAIVTSTAFLPLLPEEPSSTVLLSSRVPLLMAQVLQKHFDPAAGKFDRGPHLDPGAILALDAQVGEGAVIAAGASVGPGVVIGPDVRIGPGCVLEEGARIGRGSVLHALVYVGRDCVLGERCEIHAHATIGSDGYSYAHDGEGNHHKIPQLGVVVLEDDVEVGANSAIDRASFDTTRIGRGTKIDNLCHIAHNCQIGSRVLLTGGFMVAGSTTIGDQFVAGGRTTVRDHVTICPGVQLAGLSAVNKDVTEPGAYGGHPLQPMKKYLKTVSCLPHLPDMRKALAALEHEPPVS
jgi:UDP-3-O-[3-hydroxymyristoyl] glucosamine N-acyltransferase